MSEQKWAVLERAFSPSAPIAKMELFLGRREQLEKTCDAVNERGQHFVLFGERGVGKTSLANIISECLSNVVVSKVTCNRTEDFRQVWQKALSKVHLVREREGLGFVPEKAQRAVQLDLFLPDKPTIDSMDIQEALEQVSSRLLFIFDEFDGIRDESFQAAFADTIKALSDNAPNVTVGIVGVAESVEDLIGNHPSLERCLKQIRMPRMSDDELQQIIAKGLQMVGLEAEREVRDKIVEFSSGFPHFTHLLAKCAAKRCIDANLERIGMREYEGAIDDAIDNANQSIRDAYQRATIASRTKSKFEDVVAACALADEDEFGTFATNNLIAPYYSVTGKLVKPQSLAYNLRKLCEPERGAVLTRIGESKNIRYMFASPLMKVYVTLRLAQRGSHDRPRLSL